MSELLCDECPRKRCPSRLAGAVCSLDEKGIALIDAFKTRDPELIGAQFIGIINSEAKRYEKACKNERIGETETKTIIDDRGERTIISERKVDPAISRMADSIVKNIKTYNEIVNPKKSAPLFQKNTQINIDGHANIVADDLRTLDDNEKDSVLKFIEAQIDEKNN